MGFICCTYSPLSKSKNIFLRNTGHDLYFRCKQYDQLLLAGVFNKKKAELN